MDILQLGLIAFIAYFILKSFGSLGDLWKSGLSDLYGMTPEEASKIVITPGQTTKVWETENQNIVELIDYLKVQPASLSMMDQYKQNISDFTGWKMEEIQKLTEAQSFVTINSINPIFWLNPFNKSAMDNAKSQVIDSQNKINYYNEQIALNTEKLHGLGLLLW